MVVISRMPAVRLSVCTMGRVELSHGAVVPRPICGVFCVRTGPRFRLFFCSLLVKGARPTSVTLERAASSIPFRFL